MINIGVIGAGTMGTGIAQLAATHGHDVVVSEIDAESRIKSRDGLLKLLNRLCEKGRITDADVKAIFGRIHFTDSLESLKSCKIVIEAITEKLEVKKSVFKSVEKIVATDAILATNTSSLSVSALASSCERPEQFLGIHFFNPPALMKLVEIIPAHQTSDQVVLEARELIESWSKYTVLAKDTPGFIVNRVARPFYGEALRIYEEGLASPEEIDFVMTKVAGFRMGPFALMDYIGHDINYKVTETVWKAFYNDARYKPSFAQKALVDAGQLGRKSGRGFYVYPRESDPALVIISPEKEQLIFDRIIIMLVNEAVDALYFQVASREDIELAMTKGVNYPKGLIAWGKEIGYKKCVEHLDAMQMTYREGRYRASPLLRKYSAEESVS